MNRPDFVMSGSTVAACEAIVNYLKPHLEGTGQQVDKVQAVERHVGRFDQPNEVKRWLTGRDGGIRIAALRVASMENRGSRLVGKVEFVAYVFTSDYWGYSRDTRAEVITGRLAKLLATKGWARGLAESGVEGLRADNLYSGSLDGLGVSIWALSWRQDWALDTELDLTTLDDFLLFNMQAPIADDAPVLAADIKPNAIKES